MSLKPEVVDFEPTWSLLKETVESVITLGHVDHHDWNDRYSDVHALCVAFPEPYGDRLFQETKVYLNQHVENLHQLILLSLESLLLTYHKYWTEYRQGIIYLNKLYMYLNAQRIRKQKFNKKNLECDQAEKFDCILEIGELGLDLWKRHILEDLRDKLVHLLLEGIHNDRLGDSPNQPIFYNVIQSFVLVEEYKKSDSLMLYQKIFETPYMKDTGDYYTSEASRLLQENNHSQYMEKALQRLNDENLRSRKYLHPSSYSKVTEVFEQRMVADHLQFLLGECKALVQKECHKDLRHMYLLLKSNPSGIEALIQEMQRHIIEIGLETVNTFRRGKNFQLFVESFLGVHCKYYNLVKDLFSEDWQFIQALDKACSAIINYKENPKLKCCSPELLAKYCDFLLRKKGKTSNESEMEDKLSQCIIVFQYIEDKDVFQDLYAQTLAKRLIYELSESKNLEEAMINKLQAGMEYEFIRKFQRMFTDINISADLNADFAHYLRDENINLGASFIILVLQPSTWPLKQTDLSTFSLPQELEKGLQKFEVFYNTRFSGRNLTWLHPFFTVQLKLCYLKKKYFITMNLYQATILLLYETSDTLSYAELRENTKLSDELLRKQIQNLLETKLLLAESGKEIGPECFTINKNYFNKRSRFKLTAAQKETTQQELKDTEASIAEARKFCLQAAIVRIMKARRILHHNDLLQEVINQVKNRFVPDISVIKQCIKLLIDKEFIKNTPNSTDEYSYVAC